MTKDWEDPDGVGAVKIEPETPVPENVPRSPEPDGGEPVTGAGVAVSALDCPTHILAEDEVIVRLLF